MYSSHSCYRQALGSAESLYPCSSQGFFFFFLEGGGLLMVSELEAGPRFAERPWVSLPFSEPHVSSGAHGGNIIAVVWVLGLQESHMIEKNTHLSCPAHSVCCLSSLYLNAKAMYLPCLHLTPTSLNGKHQRSVVGGLGLGDKPPSPQPCSFFHLHSPCLGLS